MLLSWALKCLPESSKGVTFHSPFIYSPTKNRLFGSQISHPKRRVNRSTGNRYIFPTNKASDEVVALHTEASPLLATSPYHAFAAAPPCFLSSFFQAAERFVSFYQIHEEDLQVKDNPFRKPKNGETQWNLEDGKVDKE